MRRDEVHELLVHALHDEVVAVDRSRRKIHATVERLNEAMQNIGEHREKQARHPSTEPTGGSG